MPKIQKREYIVKILDVRPLVDRVKKPITTKKQISLFGEDPNSLFPKIDDIFGKKKKNPFEI